MSREKERQRVLVTGAEGTIGGAIRRRLAGRYDLVALTKEPQEFESHVGDIADLESIQPAFAGVDAVVHLAADPSEQAPWESVLRNNIVGTYNVFEASRRAGVERVVFASSNHVMGMYEVEGAPDIYRLDDPRVYDHTAEIRPDSLYGVSKAFGEALGRYYMERHGLAVFCLRIGWVRPDDGAASGFTERTRAMWLSHRDCAELVARCLDAEGVRWAVVYGISDNPRQFWDLSHARQLLGYEPLDRAPE
jgi:NAD+ dependent glucose-6-phosphate dehydrogenase